MTLYSGESCGSPDGMIESPELNSGNTTFEWIIPTVSGQSQIEYFCTQGAHCANGNQFAALIFGNGTLHTVSTNGFSFEPQSLTDVNAGDTIVWVHGGGSHTVTFGENCVADGTLNEELSNLNPLVFWQVPESSAGSTQNYFCVPHCSFSMTGSIEINEGGGDDCPSDVNDDGTVNVDDLLQLLGEFGNDCSIEACTSDVDDNGAVDVNDLLAMLGVYGEDC